MNIGLDISQISYSGTGVSRFTQGLLESILKYDKNNQWTFFFFSLRNKLDKSIETKISKSNHRLIKLPIPQSLSSLLAYEARGMTRKLTNQVKVLKNLNWFITSDWIELPVPSKKATIVHDLVFRKFPETVDSKILKTQTKRLEFVVKESDLIFADSLSTKKDLLNFYEINKEKIVVNYPGVIAVLSTRDDDDLTTLKKFQLNSPYILSVGKIEPRKNIARLIQSFEKITSNFPDLKLAIVGPKGWGKELGKSEKVKFLGYVSDPELAILYKRAKVFVYPSLYEGFGYPIIEAMRYGCPVVTSNTSSMPEIAGDAALFFDPIKVESITESINKLLEDSNLRTKLIQKGKERAQIFNWKSYYNKLVSCLT